MCGVVGALGATDEQMNEALEALQHRGIRSAIGSCSAGSIGHVRLPIVGLGQEHDQPMRRGDWLIGFVGELLDFREHNPAAECDAEVLADEWEAAGPQALTVHDGFWGVIAIHEKMRVLHVVTDYLGQKPMYYRTDRAAAASELDALKAFGPVTLDKVYLSACIKWGYCPDVERTPYNEIKHVLPGEHVILGMGRSFRKITDPIQETAMTWSATHMRLEIEAAVKRRVLSSDVQTACLVSGGVDSAIVYTLAARHGQPVPYFVISEKTDDPEYLKAKSVINGVEMPATMRVCRFDDVGIHEAMLIMQEPIDLGSLRPQIALSRAVKERVCLTGDGADELFGGYQRSQRYDSQYTDTFQELPAWHLPRLDRVMMRERIEVRSPFLARNVVRMALSLPHELRKDKIFLRQLFSDILPPSIAQAPKKALRTSEIEHDRENYSRALVQEFVEVFNAEQS